MAVSFLHAVTVLTLLSAGLFFLVTFGEQAVSLLWTRALSFKRSLPPPLQALVCWGS